MTHILDLLGDARARTLALTSDLSRERLDVPMLEHINPILWEIGHIAYFAELWTLRRLGGRPPILAGSDALYDSAKVAHDSRWSLPLPDREDTLAFMRLQLERTLSAYEPSAHAPDRDYFYHLVLLHEDMHGEALLYTRQNLGYDAPPLQTRPISPAGALAGDARVPGGRYTVGTRPGPAFVFDNEQWAHEIELDAFAIARAPVTNAEFAEFVDAGSYRNPALWSAPGWAWREQSAAEHPVYWHRRDGTFERRHFGRRIELRPHEPVCHVNAYEAQAFCAWAGRRLPSEAEWEVAASGAKARLANLDACHGGPCDVAAFPEGESVYGCRQMLGNVWEWTDSPFLPYPGFAPGPYKEYSEPWFGTHTVLRGGAWSTRTRLISTRWRNYYRPHRRDIITGFRTCARA